MRAGICRLHTSAAADGAESIEHRGRRLLTRACEKRTLNMLYMVVTLEVSRLSGRLTADAPCQDQREA